MQYFSWYNTDHSFANAYDMKANMKNIQQIRDFVPRYKNIDKTITSYSWPLLGKNWTSRTNSFKKKVFKGSNPRVQTVRAGCYRSGSLFYREKLQKHNLWRTFGQRKPWRAIFCAQGQEGMQTLHFTTAPCWEISSKRNGILSEFYETILNRPSAFISRYSPGISTSSCSLNMVTSGTMCLYCDRNNFSHSLKMSTLAI